MAFIPHNRFVIVTTLPVEKVKDKLAQVIQPKKFWPNPFSKDRKQFEGVVSKDGFSVVRNIYYLNSFIPFIKGRFNSSDSGTRIIITMAIHPLVILAIEVVFAFFGYLFLAFLTEPISGTIVIFGCLAFAYIMCTLAFKRESAVDSNFFMKLFSEQHDASRMHKER